MPQRILRPMSYGDLFDEVFDLYKKNFLVLTGIAGVVVLPAYTIAYAFGGGAANIIAMILASLVSYIAMAATTWAVSRSYLGEKATIAESYKAIGRRAFPFVLTMLAVGIFIGCGFMLLIVPGIIMAFWYAFISEVYILEGKTGRDARNRSKSLADGHWGRMFVVFLLSGLLSSIINAIITMPFSMLLYSNSSTQLAGGGPGVLYGIVTGFAAALTTPIQITASVLLYYDIRIRKEGFDIQMLAQNMGMADSTVSAPNDVTTLP